MDDIAAAAVNVAAAGSASGSGLSGDVAEIIREIEREVDEALQEAAAELNASSMEIDIWIEQVDSSTTAGSGGWISSNDTNGSGSAFDDIMAIIAEDEARMVADGSKLSGASADTDFLFWLWGDNWSASTVETPRLRGVVASEVVAPAADFQEAEAPAADEFDAAPFSDRNVISPFYNPRWRPSSFDQSDPVLPTAPMMLTALSCLTLLLMLGLWSHARRSQRRIVERHAEWVANVDEMDAELASDRPAVANQRRAW